MRSLAIACLLLAASCTGSHPDSEVDAGKDSPSSIDAAKPPADAAVPDQVTVFTILLENHDYNEIVGSPNAPYINSLIAKGGLATNYKDTGHPSTPNYLNLISGSNQYPGIIDIGPTQFPYFPASQPNLATQLEAAHIKWRSYQDGEATPCDLSDDGNYAPRHDPFLYFSDQQNGANGLCASESVDYTNFAADLAANTYRYMWISPNLIDDGHNPAADPVGALMTTDTWLSNNVPAILASPAFQHGGYLFITWDEAEGRNKDDPDQVPMIVLSNAIKAPPVTSAIAFTHSSYLATVEDLFGLPRLATVTSTPAMLSFFE